MIENKKNIGILTMPVKENYGGIIQAAALYHFLESKGYKPYLIMKKYDESFLKRIFRFILSNNPLYFIFDYKNLTRREKQVEKLSHFIDVFFKNKTTVSYNANDYVKSIKNLDYVVVGSDQVWRYKYVGNNYPYYFLDYLPEKIKKIAYAASFGGGFWEGNSDSVKHIKELLKSFNGVSLREQSGVRLCEKVFNFDKAVHVLDPTFLPEVKFYNELINKKNINKKIGLFSYVLDSSDYIDSILNSVELKRGVKRSLIELTNYKTNVKPSIEEWLYHFREADFVVTDSFHGMVFSIIFNKQFICIGNKERGLDRFVSLLSILDLENRLIVDYDEECLLKLLENKIDYSIVENRRALLKAHSVSFLNEVFDI